MFPYDPMLLAAAQARPRSIPEVIAVQNAISALCVDGDGLKWFNWLYLQVTEAVAARVASGGFTEGAWLAELDVQFAALYFDALAGFLSGGPVAGCWQALFALRSQPKIARIQFALAGMNAHINHDLALAIDATCRATATTPRHGGALYNDYTAVNTTLDTLVDAAKQTLRVRLLGDALPPVTHLEDTFAAWSVQAARESAWRNGELLWNLPAAVPLMDMIDGLTTVAGKSLLVPVP
ncbi:MAG TPA: DUF5995 family protein [Candidatus Sulfopaludibacter sp.]|jgi:hypothetical protein|nr:DUF5995 family protein [Candidatus Sulfopaludibacter sp.]